MPPLNDKVLSHMSAILARSPSGGAVAAYIVAGILGLGALIALLLWCQNITRRWWVGLQDPERKTSPWVQAASKLTDTKSPVYPCLLLLDLSYYMDWRSRILGCSEDSQRWGRLDSTVDLWGFQIIRGSQSLRSYASSLLAREFLVRILYTHEATDLVFGRGEQSRLTYPWPTSNLHNL
jgi:hypothetical protein